jgi:hypothetical protein
MSLQWSQPLNLSQVIVYSLGCEHGRRWILKHSIVIKYIKFVGLVQFRVYVTDFASRIKNICQVLGKMWFILQKFGLQSRDTTHLKSFYYSKSSCEIVPLNAYSIAWLYL